MANTVPNILKVKLNRDVLVSGATEPRGTDQVYGKAGQVHEFDRWTAMHLTSGEYPAGELVTKIK